MVASSKNYPVGMDMVVSSSPHYESSSTLSMISDNAWIASNILISDNSQLACRPLQPSFDVTEVRSKAAEAMRKSPDDYLPYLTTSDGNLLDGEGFNRYLESVAHTHEWGGQVEVITYMAPTILEAWTLNIVSYLDQRPECCLWISNTHHPSRYARRGG